MEKTATKNSLKIPLLILALLVVLGGGGFAIWSVTRKEEQEERSSEGATGAPVKGRANVSGLYTEEELTYDPLFNKDTPDKTPEYEAVLMTSKQGIRLIEDRMRKIQQHRPTADRLRATHKIGHSLVNNPIFDFKANKAIQKMFSLVDGTDGTDSLTYPVYGKFEPDGQALREDIESFLSKDGQGYNLTEFRHGGNEWWFGSVGLNLMYGNGSSHLHSADKIWWYKADRTGLDFYKLVNGHDVGDRRLLEKRNGQGVFAAWNMYNFVKEWKKQMDLFDSVTRDRAIEALEKEGLIRRI